MILLDTDHLSVIKRKRRPVPMPLSMCWLSWCYFIVSKSQRIVRKRLNLTELPDGMGADKQTC